MLPFRFRYNPILIAWLIECWDIGFADGNRLAELLISASIKKGHWFEGGDVDELLRSLRQTPEIKYLHLQTVGAGWLIQGKWLAHQSEFGRSRAALIGVQGNVHRTDSEEARFHAACFGFAPNKKCAEFAAWVATNRDKVESLESPMAAMEREMKAMVQGGKFAPGSKVKYSSKFCASVGVTGKEARKTYTVVKFLPSKQGSLADRVILDEDKHPDSLRYFSPEELAENPDLRKVSVLCCNLKSC